MENSNKESGSTESENNDVEINETSKCCCPKHGGRSKSTPIPWKILLLVFFPLFASCYSITYIFPYVPNMVLYYGHAEEDKGYYVGLIASAFFLGRILGGYFWGWLSDKKGRKPVLLICLLLVCVSNLAFGFVPNVWSAVLVRVLVGAFSGQLPIARSIIYEVSDDTNQAWCMSVAAVAYGLGTIIGPLVSGYLAEPVDKYPAAFASSGVFGQFPFLLPSLVAMVFCVVTVLPVCCKLPETLVKTRKFHIEKTDIKPDEPESQDTLIGNSEPRGSRPLRDPKQRHSLMLIPLRENPQHSTGSDHDTDELSPLPWPEDSDICFIDSGYTDEYSKVYGYGYISESHGNLYDVDLYPNKRRSWRISLTRSLSNSRSLRSLQKSKSVKSFSVFSPDATKTNIALPESLLDLSMYEIPNGNVLPAHSVILNDCDKLYIPVKQEKRPLNKKFHSMDFIRLIRQKDVCMAVMLYAIFSFSVVGYDEVYTIWASTQRDLAGLGFDSSEIGRAIGIGALPLLVVNTFLFPLLEKKIGAKRIFVVFCTILIVSSVLTPCLRFIKDSTSGLWAAVLITSALSKVAGSMCFAAVSFFINNSSTPEDVGKVNGIGMVFTAAGRFLAPLVGGSIFAWSISHGVHIGIPLDVNFVFILFGLFYLGSNILAALLPGTLNKQKKGQTL